MTTWRREHDKLCYFIIDDIEYKQENNSIIRLHNKESVQI